MARTKQQQQQARNMLDKKITIMKRKMPTWGETHQHLLIALRALVAQQFPLCNQADLFDLSVKCDAHDTTIFTQEHDKFPFPLLQQLYRKFYDQYLREWYLEELRNIHSPLTQQQDEYLRDTLKAEFAALPAKVRRAHQDLVLESRRARLVQLPELEAARLRVIKMEKHKASFVALYESHPDSITWTAYNHYLAHIYMSSPLPCHAMPSAHDSRCTYERKFQVLPRYKTPWQLLEEDIAQLGLDESITSYIQALQN